MGFRIKTLLPTDSPDSFPDPGDAGVALGQPDGLIAVGGDLSPERLLSAYRKGLFPWYNEDQPILWWSPDPRAVIYASEFHMSRSLARALRQANWEYSLNQDFAGVMRGCATDRGEYGTWIGADMLAAYERMHELGYAHSVESWLDGEFAGGIYGLRLGRVFFGESMFSRHTNGSKVALSALVSLCREAGVELIDCQVESAHLRTLGMRELPRSEFLAELELHIDGAAALPDWTLSRQDAGFLAALRATESG